MKPAPDRNRPGTIREMRTVCQWLENEEGELAPAGSAYNRHVLRPISIYVTWLFVAIGIRAHTATVMMILAGLSGIVLCIPHILTLTIAGGIFYFLFDLLDCVDGEIARWKKKSSTKGLYLDQLSHVFVDYFSLAVPALHYGIWLQDPLYVVLALAALVSSLIGRLSREIFIRINAESGVESRAPQAVELQLGKTSWQTIWIRLRKSRLLMFRITKARVVHIATLVAIFSAYSGFEGCLIFLSWFFAIYCTARMLVEIVYYFSVRVVDVPHTKTGTKNNKLI